MANENTLTTNPCNSVIYVEPNYSSKKPGSFTVEGVWDGQENTYPDPENYAIVLDLVAELPSKPVAGNTQQDNEIVGIEARGNSGQPFTVSFLRGSSVNGGQYLSTAPYEYTTVEDIAQGATLDANGDPTEGSYANPEMMGIKSVDITYNNFQTPQVRIQFVDVRGASLFQAEELAHQGVSNGLGHMSTDDYAGSFFKAFFKQPLAYFTLFVKGFYGYPKSMILSCSSFKADFDCKSGNFNVNVELVGSPYSFLADLDMTSLLASPFDDSFGADYWHNQVAAGNFLLDDGGEMDTLVDIAVKLAKLEEDKLDEDGQNAIEEAETKLQAAEQAKAKMNDSISKLKNDDAFNLVWQEHGDIIVSVKDPKKASEILADVNSKMSEANDLIKEGYSGDIESADVTNGGWTSSDGLVNAEAVKNKFAGNVSALSSIEDNEMKNKDSQYFAIQSQNSLDDINDKKQEVEKEIEDIREENQKKLDEQVIDTLGFKPSIKNITKIIFAHVDTYIASLSATANKANSTNRTLDKLGLESTDVIPSSKTVPAFPRTYKNVNVDGVTKTEDTWIGSLDGVGSSIAPEIDFVNGMLAATDAVNEILQSSGQTFNNGRANRKSAKKSRKVSVKDPAGVIDFVNSAPWMTECNTNDTGEFAGLVTLRAFSTLGMNNDYITVEDAKTMGRNDAKTFAKTIKKPSKHFLFEILSGNTITPNSIFSAVTNYKTDLQVNSKWPWEKMAKSKKLVIKRGKKARLSFNNSFNEATSGYSYSKVICQTIDFKDGHKNYDYTFSAYLGTGSTWSSLYIDRDHSGYSQIYDELDDPSKKLMPYLKLDVGTYMAALGKDEFSILDDMICLSSGDTRIGYGKQSTYMLPESKTSSAITSGLTAYARTTFSGGTVSPHANAKNKFFNKSGSLKSFYQLSGDSVTKGEYTLKKMKDFIENYDEAITTASFDHFNGIVVEGDSFKITRKKCIYGQKLYYDQTDERIKCLLFLLTNLPNFPIISRYVDKLTIDIKRKVDVGGYVPYSIFLILGAILKFDDVGYITESPEVDIIIHKLRDLTIKRKLLKLDIRGKLVRAFDKYLKEDYLQIASECEIHDRYNVAYSGEKIDLIASYFRNASTWKDVLENLNMEFQSEGLKKVETFERACCKLFNEYFFRSYSMIYSDFSGDDLMLVNRLTNKSLKNVVLDTLQPCFYFRTTSKGSDKRKIPSYATIRGVSGNTIVKIGDTAAFNREKAKYFLNSNGSGKTKFNFDVKFNYASLNDDLMLAAEETASGENGAIIKGLNRSLTNISRQNTTRGSSYQGGDVNGDEAVIDANKLTAYYDGMCQGLKEEWKNKRLDRDYRKGDPSNVEYSQTDDQIRLAYYKYAKTMYDKWLCNMSQVSVNQVFCMASEDSYFHNNIYFIDAYYNNIGDLTNINMTQLKEMVVKCFENVYGTMQLSSFLSSLMSAANFGMQFCDDFLDLTGTNDKSKSKLEKLFDPIPVETIDWSTEVDRFPDLVFLYTYETSTKLNGDENFQGDSFDISGKSTELPKAISSKDVSSTDFGYKIPAFGVTYGMGSQSYFTNIQVGMDNPTVTEASLRVQYQLGANALNQGGNSYNEASNNGSTALFLGQDLFTVYSNNAYECTVEMMGCPYIQAMMYFQLNNVPMFNGTYIIYKVSHSIVPGNMTTRFSGHRISAIQTPLVNKEIRKHNVFTLGGDNPDQGMFASITNDCEYKVFGIPAPVPATPASDGGGNSGGGETTPGGGNIEGRFPGPKGVGPNFSSYLDKKVSELPEYPWTVYGNSVKKINPDCKVIDMLAMCVVCEGGNLGDVIAGLVAATEYNNFIGNDKKFDRINHKHHAILGVEKPTFEEMITTDVKRFAGTDCNKIRSIVREIWTNSPSVLVGLNAPVRTQTPTWYQNQQTSEMTKTKNIEMIDVQTIDSYLCCKYFLQGNNTVKITGGEYSAQAFPYKKRICPQWYSGKFRCGYEVNDGLYSGMYFVAGKGDETYWSGSGGGSTTSTAASNASATSTQNKKEDNSVVVASSNSRKVQAMKAKSSESNENNNIALAAQTLNNGAYPPCHDDYVASPLPDADGNSDDKKKVARAVYNDLIKAGVKWYVAIGCLCNCHSRMTPKYSAIDTAKSDWTSGKWCWGMGFFGDTVTSNNSNGGKMCKEAGLPNAPAEMNKKIEASSLHSKKLPYDLYSHSNKASDGPWECKVPYNIQIKNMIEKCKNGGINKEIQGALSAGYSDCAAACLAVNKYTNPAAAKNKINYGKIHIRWAKNSKDICDWLGFKYECFSEPITTEGQVQKFDSGKVVDPSTITSPYLKGKITAGKGDGTGGGYSGEGSSTCVTPTPPSSENSPKIAFLGDSQIALTQGAMPKAVASDLKLSIDWFGRSGARASHYLGKANDLQTAGVSSVSALSKKGPKDAWKHFTETDKHNVFIVALGHNGNGHLKEMVDSLKSSGGKVVLVKMFPIPHKTYATSENMSKLYDGISADFTVDLTKFTIDENDFSVDSDGSLIHPKADIMTKVGKEIAKQMGSFVSQLTSSVAPTESSTQCSSAPPSGGASNIPDIKNADEYFEYVCKTIGYSKTLKERLKNLSMEKVDDKTFYMTCTPATGMAQIFDVVMQAYYDNFKTLAWIVKNDLSEAPSKIFVAMEGDRKTIGVAFETSDGNKDFRDFYDDGYGAHRLFYQSVGKKCGPKMSETELCGMSPEEFKMTYPNFKNVEDEEIKNVLNVRVNSCPVPKEQCSPSGGAPGGGAAAGGAAGESTGGGGYSGKILVEPTYTPKNDEYLFVEHVYKEVQSPLDSGSISLCGYIYDAQTKEIICHTMQSKHHFARCGHNVGPGVKYIHQHNDGGWENDGANHQKHAKYVIDKWPSAKKASSNSSLGAILCLDNSADGSSGCLFHMGQGANDVKGNNAWTTGCVLPGYNPNSEGAYPNFPSPYASGIGSSNPDPNAKAWMNFYDHVMPLIIEGKTVRLEVIEDYTKGDPGIKEGGGTVGGASGSVPPYTEGTMPKYDGYNVKAACAAAQQGQTRWSSGAHGKPSTKNPTITTNSSSECIANMAMFAEIGLKQSGKGWSGSMCPLGNGWQAHTSGNVAKKPFKLIKEFSNCKGQDAIDWAKQYCQPGDLCIMTSPAGSCGHGSFCTINSSGGKAWCSDYWQGDTPLAWNGSRTFQGVVFYRYNGD